MGFARSLILIASSTQTTIPVSFALKGGQPFMDPFAKKSSVLIDSSVAVEYVRMSVPPATPTTELTATVSPVVMTTSSNSTVPAYKV